MVLFSDPPLPAPCFTGRLLIRITGPMVQGGRDVIGHRYLFPCAVYSMARKVLWWLQEQEPQGEERITGWVWVEDP